MAALASRLREGGTEVTVVTPSRTPRTLAFAFGDLPVFEARDPAAHDPIRAADLLVILDTAEPHRLGGLAEHLHRCDGVVIDHHPPVGAPLVEPALRDPTACSTGELIFDLLGLEGDRLSALEAQGLYIAIVTDTGSFQFSNTTTRTHQIAARLVEAGVDPEAMYRRLYAVYTRGGLALIQRALQRLEVDPLSPIAWVAVDHGVLKEAGARGEDMEGLVEYPRRLEGMEVGLFFRALSSTRTKVSLRSNGDVDVSSIAQELGGGGHAKASGVVLELELEEAIRVVVDKVRPAALEACGRE